jgi:protease-4
MTDRPVKKVTFGRIFWPSLVAILVASFITMILFFTVLGGVIGSLMSSSTTEVESGPVLHMTLEGQISEGETKFNPSSFGMDNKIGLSDILYGLETAKKDSKIKGVFLELKNLNCGFASAREIRNAINDFEESGKFVVAFNGGEVITQKEYYVSSAANENYGFPTSTMEFNGLGAELMFFKNTLDKLEVEMQVIRGNNNDFKSAVEPFFRTDMSDSSRVQIEKYLSSIWMDIRMDISKDRKLTVEELNDIAENLKIHRAQDAVDYKLLDGTKYKDEVLAIVAKKAGEKTITESEMIAFEKYAKKGLIDNQKTAKTKSANVAVILAEGDVSVSGDGLSSDKICKYVREAREDKSIKTIVLRVNSPGGSALASDEIWREVQLANKTKKVIVSMGDVAASGGYYIASPADRIFAEPTTITGSIGVFGVIPFIGKMLENKLGLTFDRAQTNKHSVMSLNRKLTVDELAIIQTEVDAIYAQFLSRVSEGRGIPVDKVNQMARGRVWTGTDAKRIGLVDELGGMKDAIAYAAKKAGIKDVSIRYWPEKKTDALTELIETITDSESAEISSQTQLPEDLIYYYQQLKKLEGMQGIQMRMPYEIILR